MQAGAVKLNEIGYASDPNFPWHSLSGQPATVYDNLVYGKFTPDRIQLREQAATALADYGVALLALVNYDGSQNLQSAADALAASIKGLPPQAKVISNADADLLSQIVQQLGGLLLEKMKADAVRRIVPTYHPQVVKLCSLLSDDFSPERGQLASEYVELARTIREDEVMILDRNGTRIDVRARAIPALAASSKEYQWARHTLPEIAKGGVKCAAASEALVKAITNRQYSPSDLKDFGEQVQKLYSTARKWK
jgi:hypothetical protein